MCVIFVFGIGQGMETVGAGDEAGELVLTCFVGLGFEGIRERSVGRGAVEGNAALGFALGVDDGAEDAGALSQVEAEGEVGEAR